MPETLPFSNQESEDIATIEKNPESISIQENTVESAQESIAHKLEQAIETTEKKLEQLGTVLDALSPQEGQAVVEALSNKEDGKKILALFHERYNSLMEAMHHEEKNLSEKYNPRLIKAINSTGKVIGGLTGMMAGHGIASAAGAVVGAKGGSLTFLKAFSFIAEKLPRSVQEKIMNSPISANEGAIEPKSENSPENDPSKSVEEAIALREKMLKELALRSQEIQNLSPEDRKIFTDAIEQDTKTIPTLNRMRDTYERYNSFYHEFEKRHPLKTAALEVAVHYSIGPLAHSLGATTEVFHAIEMLAAGGGAEAITKPITQFLSRTKERIGQSVTTIKDKVNIMRTKVGPPESKNDSSAIN